MSGYERERREIDRRSPAPPETLPPNVQAKLAVGSVDDPAEREADRVAAEVVRRITNGDRVSPVAAHGNGSSRIRRNSAGSDLDHVGAGGGEVSGDLGGRIQQARSGGNVLEEPVRRQMEGAFGADFSGVRVHTGSEASDISRSISARAFTVGSDIFFDGNSYQPDTASGRHLLAHELTHTVQQGSSRVQRAPATPAASVRRHSNPDQQIRRLTVANTKWDKTKIVNVAQAGGSGTVAMFNDGSGEIVVKSNQLVSAEVVVAGGLLEATSKKEKGYSVHAPEVRMATSGEIDTIRNVTGQKLQGDGRNFVTGLGKNATLVMKGFGGKDFDKIIKEDKHTQPKTFGDGRKLRSNSILAQMTKDRGPCTVLGRAAAIDAFMGMGDRMLGSNFNPQNFRYDSKKKVFGFVDNTENADTGFLTTVTQLDYSISDPRKGFTLWTGLNYVQEFSADNFNGIATRLFTNIFSDNGIGWDLGQAQRKNKDKQVVLDAFNANAAAMKGWLAAGAQAGKQGLMGALADPVKATAGLTPVKQHEAVGSLIARRHFLNGDDANIAWGKGQQEVINLLGDKPSNSEPDWVDIIKWFTRMAGVDGGTVDVCLYFNSRDKTKVNRTALDKHLADDRAKKLAAIKKAGGFSDGDMLKMGLV
jgi:hypothetical protein